MIDHLVLFKFKGTPDPLVIKKMDQQLMGLAHVIPEIINITSGANFSTRNKGYDHGLVVRLKSKSDLEIYAGHPAHLKVINDYIRPIVEDTIALDYEY